MTTQLNWFFHSNDLAILHKDCADVFLEDGSVDLIITSPPYANARAKTYGGVEPDQYVEWFMRRAGAFHFWLKPAGSFILNIKEKVVDGERHPYVHDLIRALRASGWLWTEEYIWHKTTCFPGKWPGRFRDAWEHCFHFTKQRQFAMNQDAVMVLPAESTVKRAANVSPRDRERFESGTKSPFARKISQSCARSKVYPTNVLHLAPECSNRGHSAAFPEALPEFFIKLFTKPGDLVVDPFLGSGTTAVVARRLGRQCLGIDIHQENCEVALKRLQQTAGAAPFSGHAPAPVFEVSKAV